MNKRYLQVLFFVLACLLFLWGVIHAHASELVCYNNPESLIIQKLIKCESGFNYGAINHDDGDSDSLGIVQWKKSSYVHYSAKYRLLSDMEAKEMMNPELQLRLAKLVLKEPKGWKNWYMCLKGMYQ